MESKHSSWLVNVIINIIQSDYFCIMFFFPFWKQWPSLSVSDVIVNLRYCELFKPIYPVILYRGLGDGYRAYICRWGCLCATNHCRHHIYLNNFTRKSWINPGYIFQPLPTCITSRDHLPTLILSISHLLHTLTMKRFEPESHDQIARASSP